ncbi:MAG: hypothetical protein HYT42_00785 [Candidatus Sungbacteria bacterium]|uniref:Uncharacterized protein n=1 Tax=Candidatus Sungiibacteriota bacterium TaxID=2750080 RepID=A0A933DRS2_9BACT|nr:hypothetical protein [Candidatus Sungbacteria bacterium]MBI4132460.1 hypothetical protein [Candidatus Sungbacteria bacterium]
MGIAADGKEAASIQLVKDAEEFAQKVFDLQPQRTVFSGPDEDALILEAIKAFMDQRAKGGDDMKTVLAEVAPFVEALAGRTHDEVTGMTGEELFGRICAALQGRGVEPRPTLVQLRREEREQCIKLICGQCARGDRPVLRDGCWWHGTPRRWWSFLSNNFCDAAEIWHLINESG